MPAGPLGEGAFEYLKNMKTSSPIEVISGPEVYSIVFDFNNDGLPDIFSLSENTTYYPPGKYTGSNNFNNNDVYT